MGSSSRPLDFNRHTFNENQCIDYFVEYFEKWRIQMGDLKNFYLAGHSFGGYLIGNYALKYHQNIKKILFISPCGFYKKPKDLRINKRV